MAVKTISDFGFTPEDGLRDTSYSPTEPESEAAIRGQIQGVSDQLRDHINSVQEKLRSRTAGSAGADYIGAADIDDLDGESVAEQLAALKGQVDGVVLGQIPAGAISAAKLADGAVTAAKLGEGAVEAAAIAAGAVTAAKLATGAVTTAKLGSGAVTTAKLADGAVTTAKVGELAGLNKRQVLTSSQQWSPPADGFYRVTLYGGGGGGGAGWQRCVRNSHRIAAGGGGKASKPVSGEFYLRAGASYTFVIGAGGEGQTTKSWTSDTSCSALATSGGESSFKAGTKVLLQTLAADRLGGSSPQFLSNNDGTTNGIAQGQTVSSPVTIVTGASVQSGCPGGDLSCASAGNSVSYVAGSGGVDVAACDPGYGGGYGGAVSVASAAAGTGIPGGPGLHYGCGGGGGGMVCSSPLVSGSVQAGVVNAGGDGADGAAIIEWF